MAAVIATAGVRMQDKRRSNEKAAHSRGSCINLIG